MDDLDRVVNSLRKINSGEVELRELGILRDSKELTTHLGEWIGEKLLNAERAKSSSQKGWDLITPSGERIQVRTERKDKNNPFRDSFSVAENELSLADSFLFISFDTDRSVRHIYYISSKEISKVGSLKKDKNSGEIRFELFLPVLQTYEIKDNPVIDRFKKI